MEADHRVLHVLRLGPICCTVCLPIILLLTREEVALRLLCKLLLHHLLGRGVALLLLLELLPLLLLLLLELLLLAEGCLDLILMTGIGLDCSTVQISGGMTRL